MFKSNREPMKVGSLVSIKSGVRNISETVWIVTKVEMVNGGSFRGKIDMCRIEAVISNEEIKPNNRSIYGYELKVISEVK